MCSQIGSILSPNYHNPYSNMQQFAATCSNNYFCFLFCFCFFQSPFTCHIKNHMKSPWYCWNWSGIKTFVAKSGKIATISMGILIIHTDDKDAGCGRFFWHFLVHQMFQIVERDVPPDIGRRMGGVSLLFVPLKLCGPPTIWTPMGEEGRSGVTV